MTFKAPTAVVWWWRCKVHKSSSPESPSSQGAGGVIACNSNNSSSATTLRVFLHIVACIASLALGLRFSREPLLVGICVIQQQPQALLLGEDARAGLKWLDNQQQIQSTAASPVTVPSKSSRVHVGRHEILVRPWPHPNPSELAAAQAIIDRVQREQRKLYEAGQEVKNAIIAITPTLQCPFRALHLKMLGNALSLAPAKITWIVVEAGGPSNATAEVLEASGVSHFHLGFAHSGETRLRIEGLRFVRENKLEGIVIFADVTNTHSLHLFDEVRKVKWVGAFAVGFPLGGSQLLEEAAAAGDDEDGAASNAHQMKRGVLVHRPVCNQSSAQIVGWQSTLDSLHLSWHQHVEPLYSEWSGFAINAKLLWLEDEERPGWIASWEHWSASENASIVGGLNGLVKNESVVEALGNCGQDVLLWWLRIEPCSGCRYPSRWVIGPPLEVVVPWRRTPWPPASLPRPPPPPSPPPPPPPGSSLRQRLLNQSELNMEPTRLGPKQKSPSDKKKKKKKKNGRKGIDNSIPQHLPRLLDARLS